MLCVSTWICGINVYIGEICLWRYLWGHDDILMCEEDLYSLEIHRRQEFVSRATKFNKFLILCRVFVSSSSTFLSTQQKTCHRRYRACCVWVWGQQGRQKKEKHIFFPALNLITTIKKITPNSYKHNFYGENEKWGACIPMDNEDELMNSHNFIASHTSANKSSLKRARARKVQN